MGKANLNDVLTLLRGWSDSEFAEAASGEFCEDIKTMIEGAISRALDPTTDASGLVERLEAMVSHDGKAIVCNGRTTKAMCDDIADAAMTRADLIARVERRGWKQGYVMAISTTLHQHGCTVTAEDALRDSGITWEEVEQMDLEDFDLDVLRPVYETMRQRKAAACLRAGGE